MIQMFRVLFAYPVFFVLQKIVQRFSIFAALVVLITAIFFTKDYVANLFLTSNVDNYTTNLEQASQNIITKEVLVKNGDTLGGILHSLKLKNEDVKSIIKLAQSKNIIYRLKAGQTIVFNYGTELIETPDSDLNKEQIHLNRMLLKMDRTNSVEFVRQDENFVVHNITTPLKRLVTQYEATIDISFMSSLKKAGMSTNNIIRLINAYSHQIDFQRQIKSGDKITVLAEKFVTDQDEFSHHGDILYSSLKTKKNEYNIYNYSPTKKTSDMQFFTGQGTSIKSTLLRTPVNVVRISSHFGYRKHPVLGYGAMHKGVDFAAAVGTPIYAAGNGVVEFVGWKSGYGRFILLKHNNTLSTAYAHASKFSKNLKRGSKIKQGDIIAYVGTSGRSTGPHLHYEVRVNGEQVNPMKFKSTPGIKLTGAKLAEFNKHKEQVKYLSKKLTNDITVSAADINLF